MGNFIPYYAITMICLLVRMDGQVPKGDVITTTLERVKKSLLYDFNISNVSSVTFEVEACSEAYITLLHSDVIKSVIYKIEMGICDNMESVIQNNSYELISKHQEAALLHCNEFRMFQIAWDNETVKVYKQTYGAWTVILCAIVQKQFHAKFISISSLRRSRWRIYKEEQLRNMTSDSCPGLTTDKSLVGACGHATTSDDFVYETTTDSINSRPTDISEHYEEEIYSKQSINSQPTTLHSTTARVLLRSQRTSESTTATPQHFSQQTSKDTIPKQQSFYQQLSESETTKTFQRTLESTTARLPAIFVTSTEGFSTKDGQSSTDGTEQPIKSRFTKESIITNRQLTTLPTTVATDFRLTSESNLLNVTSKTPGGNLIYPACDEEFADTSRQCEYVCIQNSSTEDFTQIIPLLKKSLLYDRKIWSKYIRTKISASDDRNSAVLIGCMGGAILIALVIGLVIIDLPNLIQMVKNMTDRKCVRHSIFSHEVRQPKHFRIDLRHIPRRNN